MTLIEYAKSQTPLTKWVQDNSALTISVDSQSNETGKQISAIIMLPRNETENEP